MAQEMFEENKVLQSEIDALKSVIAEHLPLMTKQMRDDFESTLYSLPSSDSTSSGYYEEEACEECGWWKPQCKCEENEDE